MGIPISFSFTDATGAVLSNTATLSEGPANRPLIVFLHGLGRTGADWTAPERMGRHFNTSAPLPPDVVVGTFGHPATGPAGPPVPDPLLPSITSFDAFLRQNGFQTLVYNQIDATLTLARPALELAAPMRTLHALPGLAERRFVLLCHSRGGLLARKFLKDNRNAPAAVGRIIKVITLHSPHHGSLWGNQVTAPGVPTVTMAAALDAVVNTMNPAAGPVVTGLLAPFIGFTTTPAYLEMRVGGPFITDLESGEEPLPDVEYHTFGGTSVLFSRLTELAYTVSSAAPVPGVGFTHVITSVVNPAISPVWTAYPPINASAETTPGLGDFLVSDASSRLPFSTTHHTNPVNHAEVLWAPVIHQQVLELLRAPGVWGNWTLHRDEVPDARAKLRLVRDERGRLLLFAGGTFTARWKRELAAGDPVPSGLSPLLPGEARGWSDWTDFDWGGRFGFAAEFDKLPERDGDPSTSHLHIFALGLPSDVPDSVGGFLPAAANAWLRRRGPGPVEWSTWMDIGGTAYGPSDLRPALTALHSTLHGGLAVVRNLRGELELFASGSGDKLWTAHQVQQAPPGHFSTWSRLPIPSQGRVSVVLDQDGSVLVFVYRASAKLSCYRRAPGSEWWEEWVLPDQPGLRLCVAIRDGSDKVVLVARDGHGIMWWTRQRMPPTDRLPDRYGRRAATGIYGVLVRIVPLLGTIVDLLGSLFASSEPRRIYYRWQPWTPEEGAVVGELSAAQNEDGRLAVVARGPGGQVLHRVEMEPGGGWSPWQDLGGEVAGTPVIGRLADGRLAVLALSTEGHVRQRTQSAPGRW